MNVIYFPAGNYLIKSTISLPNSIILKGEREATNLQFDLSRYTTSNANCIEIERKQLASFTRIKNGFKKNSTKVVVDSTTDFIING